jgi:hypothetical protein
MGTLPTNVGGAMLIMIAMMMTPILKIRLHVMLIQTGMLILVLQIISLRS